MAMMAGGFLGGALAGAAAAFFKLRGKAPPSGDRLRPPPAAPKAK